MILMKDLIATFQFDYRYIELFISNSLLHDYIDRILKDERSSLNDTIIANFMEIFYGKVS